MKCGACGGFYNPQCSRWSACRPAEPDPPRRVVVRPYLADSADYVAVFHGFSTDSEQLNDGVAPYPCAIVEREDGSVESVPANSVTFQEPTK